MPDFPDADGLLGGRRPEGSLRKTEEGASRRRCADANGHTPLHQCAFMGFEAVAGALLAGHAAACVHART